MPGTMGGETLRNCGAQAAVFCRTALGPGGFPAVMHPLIEDRCRQAGHATVVPPAASGPRGAARR